MSGSTDLNELTNILRNSFRFNQAAKTDKQKLSMFYELINCAGDLASGIENEDTSSKILDETLHLADLVVGEIEKCD